MVNGVGGSGAGRAALEAALERMRARTGQMSQPEQLAQLSEASAGDKGSFKAALETGAAHVDRTLERTESLHLEVLQGKLDIHEVAAQLKESELSFQFALQVRNKLIDAYREVMRMTV